MEARSGGELQLSNRLAESRSPYVSAHTSCNRSYGIHLEIRSVAI